MSNTGISENSNVVLHRSNPRSNTRKYHNMFVGFETQAQTNAHDPTYIRDKNELENREQSTSDLIETRERTHADFRQSQKDLEDFKELVQITSEALKVKKPSDDQNLALVRLDETISTIDLTNMDALTPEKRRQGQTAAHLVELNKQVDENRKLWNAATKEFEENQSFIRKIRDRLANGQTTELAVHGNHVNFIPGREKLSMLEDNTSQMRAIWALMEGDALLELKFHTLKSSLIKLRRSVGDDLLQMSKGLHEQTYERFY